MPRDRRIKIEVSTDSQPQFELGDTADDIERRRIERQGRDEREARKGGECEREVGNREDGRDQVDGRD